MPNIKRSYVFVNLTIDKNRQKCITTQSDMYLETIDIKSFKISLFRLNLQTSKENLLILGDFSLYIECYRIMQKTFELSANF